MSTDDKGKGIVMITSRGSGRTRPPMKTDFGTDDATNPPETSRLHVPIPEAAVFALPERTTSGSKLPDDPKAGHPAKVTTLNTSVNRKLKVSTDAGVK